MQAIQAVYSVSVFAELGVLLNNALQRLVGAMRKSYNFFKMFSRQKKVPDATPHLEAEYHCGIYRVWKIEENGLSFYYAHSHRGGMAEHIWICSKYGRYDLRYLDGSICDLELYWGGSVAYYVYTLFMLSIRRKQLAEKLLTSWREKTSNSYLLLEEYCRSGKFPE